MRIFYCEDCLECIEAEAIQAWCSTGHEMKQIGDSYEM